MKKYLKFLFLSLLACIICAIGVFSYILFAPSESSRDVKRIEKACNANDFATAHQILSRLRQGCYDAGSRKDYLYALETLYTRELTYIVLNYPEDAELRIMVRMNEIQALGEKPVKDEMEVEFHDSFEYDSYRLWLSSYNTICRKLLDLAINIKNQQIAQLAVSLTKENLQIKEYASYDYGITVVDTDRKSITSRYEDAVNSGLFK